MGNEPTTPPPGGQTPPVGDPPGQTPTQLQQTVPPGQTPGSPIQQQQQQPPPPSTRTSLDSLPQDVQDMIHVLRNEARDLRKQRDAELAAKQQADEERMRKQGQFEELAKKHEARVKELEPIADRYKRLTDLVNEQIKTGTKDWPAEVKAFDPGPSAPVEERYAWYEKAGPLVAKLATQTNVYAPGNTPSPRPASGNQQQQGDIEALRARYQSQRGNPF